MNAVKSADEHQRDSLIDIRGTVFVDVDIRAEVGDAPTTLLSASGNSQNQQDNERQECLEGLHARAEKQQSVRIVILNRFLCRRDRC